MRFYPVCNVVSKPATDSHAHIDKKNSDTWVGDTANVLQQKAAARVVTSLPHAVLIPTGQFEEARNSAALAEPVVSQEGNPRLEARSFQMYGAHLPILLSREIDYPLPLNITKCCQGGAGGLFS